MLADRIAAESLERLREMEVAATVGAVEVAPLAVDVARASVTGVPSAELQAAIEQIAAADAVIAAAPVYKAGISGLFKSFVDVLDNDLLVAKPVVLAVVIQGQIEQGIVDRAWSGYQHEFAGNATRAEQTAADADFDSPLMRLAAGGRTN